ncbi:hypothetical protein [Ktedonospora formicarum]|uniref:DUF4177 domain-containing protein n=1 Tax=Ktedonospora formicarum TaxID=2778364 RepID=A0A8J3I2U1_9CHLR|nr:hypothetical protein [Ktedonospora formicarum]GHO45202.1 hypothetical protein KSX_33650 [Ktedonospora formicarum]
MKKKELPYSPQQPGQPQQITQFYHKTLGKLAADNFEKDCREMEADGWRLVFATPLGHGSGSVGTDSPIVAIYQK